MREAESVPSHRLRFPSPRPSGCSQGPACRQPGPLGLVGRRPDSRRSGRLVRSKLEILEAAILNVALKLDLRAVSASLAKGTLILCYT